MNPPNASLQARRDLAKRRRLQGLRVKASERRAVEERLFIESTWIEDKDKGCLVPFKLWQAQIDLLPLLQEPRLLLLKARQLGLTWLDLAHWLYETTFWGHRLILIARQTLNDAIDGIHRVKVMHDSLPEKWRQPITADNVLSLAFANGSRFEAVTSTTRIAHGRAAYGGLLDEFSLYEHQAEVLAGAGPACARLHIVTTGNGEGDLTHAIWDQAGQGIGEWKRMFLPWTAHPDRDEEWYRKHVTENPEPRHAQRQYASSPEDAFRSPAGAYFERFTRERNTDQGWDAKITPQPAWKTWRGVDFGFRHPACVWMQKAPSGQLFAVAEYAPENITTEEYRDGIMAMDARLGVMPLASYCDPAGRAANVQTAESEFEVLKRAGLNPRSKPSGIRDGCMRIMNLLADPDLPLIVSEDCPQLIRCLTQVKPDKSKPELYDQREDSPYQHLLDALRYLLVNLRDGGPFKPPGSGASRERGGGRSTAF